MRQTSDVIVIIPRRMDEQDLFVCRCLTLTGRAVISTYRKSVFSGLSSNSEGRVLCVFGGAIEGRQVDS